MRKLEGAGPRVVARIVAGIAQRQSAPARAGRVVAGRAVDDHGVEHQAVARRHLPPADVVPAAIGVDVGDLREIAVGELDLMALAEGRRPVVDAPAMRAGDELDGAVAAVDRIERDPYRRDLPALYRPVGLVLVPRRRMRRARLLHEELVVEEIGRRRAHQLRGDGRGRGVPARRHGTPDRAATCTCRRRTCRACCLRRSWWRSVRARRGRARRPRACVRPRSDRTPGAGRRRRRDRRRRRRCR